MSPSFLCRMSTTKPTQYTVKAVSRVVNGKRKIFIKGNPLKYQQFLKKYTDNIFENFFGTKPLKMNRKQRRAEFYKIDPPERDEQFRRLKKKMNDLTKKMLETQHSLRLEMQHTLLKENPEEEYPRDTVCGQEGSMDGPMHEMD